MERGQNWFQNTCKTVKLDSDYGFLGHPLDSALSILKNILFFIVILFGILVILRLLIIISDLEIIERPEFQLLWMNCIKFDFWPNTQKVIWKVVSAQSQTRKKLHLKSGIFCIWLNVLWHTRYFWTGCELGWIFPWPRRATTTPLKATAMHGLAIPPNPLIHTSRRGSLVDGKPPTESHLGVQVKHF